MFLKDRTPDLSPSVALFHVTGPDTQKYLVSDGRRKEGGKEGRKEGGKKIGMTVFLQGRGHSTFQVRGTMGVKDQRRRR